MRASRPASRRASMRDCVTSMPSLLSARRQLAHHPVRRELLVTAARRATTAS